METMKKFFKKYYKKFFEKKQEFTGFEVKLWQEGKLMNRSLGSLDGVTVFHFPCGTVIETPNGLILSGYRIVPHLEERT